MRHISKLAALMLVLLVPLGCKTRLAQGGAYTSPTLYEADLVISTSWSICDSVVRWESDNRELLAQVPEIKRAADEIRQHAPTALRAAIAARDAYEAAGTEEAGLTLDGALTGLRQVATEAMSLLSQYGGFEP